MDVLGGYQAKQDGEVALKDSSLEFSGEPSWECQGYVPSLGDQTGGYPIPKVEEDPQVWVSPFSRQGSLLII